MEVLFAISLFAIMTTGVLILSVSTLQREARIGVEAEAKAYVGEGLEAARNIRDKDYLALVDGDHGVTLAAEGWSFEGTETLLDDYYTRVVSVEPAYRDSTGDLIESGGTLDPNTKKITSTVSWNYKALLPRSLSMSAYLTNWAAFDWMQTTCTEFNAGTHTNTTTQSAAAPPADNCVLNLDIIEEAGTFFVSTDIGEHGNDVVVEGNYAYVATHKTAEGLAVVDISDIEAPVVVAHVNVDGKGRTVTKEGDYLYMGVEKSTKGLAIIDVSDPTDPELESSVNVGGYGNGVAIVGDTLFMGVESSSSGFKIYDISDPENPSLNASLNVGASVRDIEASGNYAYLTASSSSGGFKVIDITTLTLPTVLSSLDIGAPGNAVWLEPPFAYVSAESASDSLQVVNVSAPASPGLLTTLDVGEEIQDIAKSGNYLYATLDQVNPGMAVINASSPTAPSLSYTVDIGGKGTGVTLDGEHIYAGVDTANLGLVIVGEADVSVASSGTFISSVLNTGTVDPRYNYLDWEWTEVPGSTIQLQIRTASSEAGLSSAQWVGPDGTGSTYFDTTLTPIVTAPTASGMQYFQFRVTLTSDGFTTPSLESVTINYTP